MSAASTCTAQRTTFRAAFSLCFVTVIFCNTSDRLCATLKHDIPIFMLKAKRELTQKQIEKQQKKRSEAARKAAQARWSKERPLSKVALKQQIARVPTSELTVEHYADRPNPELSWAAAILKRRASGKRQRSEAARIFSQASRQGQSTWSNLSPEQRSEIARRGGVRRWEIWREEQARLSGKSSSSESR